MSGRPIMIMAGGTGGHVFPGLAVAEILQSKHRDVVWLGTKRGLEARVVPSHGIEMHWISIAGVRKRGVLAWLIAPAKILMAIAQSLRALYRCRPAAVLGLGGFVAGPGGIAAWLARKPLVIHEQNAVAGTTNRLLARFARRVYEGFPDSFPAGTQTTHIGNPVRKSIVELALRARPPRGADAQLKLLVLGGSQGALALNRAVPSAVEQLSATRPLIRHQAGLSVDAARTAYANVGVDAEVLDFIDDMAAAYSWADLVIARAGALTIAELAAAGVGAILVPYPHAVDDHQTKNAEQFIRDGAGVLLAESELSADNLAGELERILASTQTLDDMSRAARAQAMANAADTLAAACLELAGLPS